MRTRTFGPGRRLTTALAIAGVLVAALAAPATGRPSAVPAANPGPPVLTFQTQPSASATGGVPFASQPVVRDVDAAGNPRIGDPVILTIVTGSGTPDADLTCDDAVLTDANGLATFSSCSIDKAGSGYRLLAQVSRIAAQTATSSTITVAVGPPTRISFVQAPIAAYIGHPFDIVAGITDAGGNPAGSGVSATISLSIDPDTIEAVDLNCPGGFTAQTATSGALSGVATFAGCTLDEPFAAGEDVILLATPSNVIGVQGLPAVQSAPIELKDPTEAPLPALTLTRSASSITYTQSVVFTAVFSGGGGRTVELQRSEDVEDWFSIATLTLDSAGRATFSSKPRTTGRYRVVYAGPPNAAAGTSLIVTVIVREQATQVPVQSSPKIITRGSRVTFTTTARPIGSDLPRVEIEFSVYRLVSGAWTLSATRVVDADSTGRARLTWTFATAGEWYVRSKARGSQDEVAQPGRTADSSPTPAARYRVK